MSNSSESTDTTSLRRNVAWALAGNLGYSACQWGVLVCIAKLGTAADVGRFALSREGYIRVASTDGVVRIIGDRWDSLHPIPDEQVEAVRRLVSSGDRARAVPWIGAGDCVRIVAGPLEGLEGRVQLWHRGRATFVVSVDLLQRSVAVEVAAEVVEKV